MSSLVLHNDDTKGLDELSLPELYDKLDAILAKVLNLVQLLALNLLIMFIANDRKIKPSYILKLKSRIFYLELSMYEIFPFHIALTIIVYDRTI